MTKWHDRGRGGYGLGHVQVARPSMIELSLTIVALKVLEAMSRRLYEILRKEWRREDDNNLGRKEGMSLK